MIDFTLTHKMKGSWDFYLTIQTNLKYVIRACKTINRD